MNGRLDLNALWAAVAAAIGTPTGKSATAFVLGAMALAVSGLVVVRGDISRSAEAAASLLTQESKELKAEAKALAEAEQAKDENALTSVPAFIDRVGALAARHEATIGAVQPERGDDSLFRIGLAAPYRALLGFISELEGLDVEVKGFKVKRRALGAGAPMLDASVSIRPRNEARDLSIPRLDAVQAAIAAEAARDPFQALVAGDEDAGGHRLDLSEAYRLTGIATIQPSGERIATIDLFDYVAGDVLDGRAVVAVEADRVLLVGLDASEGEKYVIRFRRPIGDSRSRGSARPDARPVGGPERRASIAEEAAVASDVARTQARGSLPRPNQLPGNLIRPRTP